MAFIWQELSEALENIDAGYWVTQVMTSKSFGGQ